MGCAGRFSGICVWVGQNKTVIDKKCQKNACQNEEGEAPGIWNFAGRFFQKSCQYYQQSLTGDRSKAIEGAANAYEEGLLRIVQR